MKRLGQIFIFFVLVASFVACSKNDAIPPTEELANIMPAVDESCIECAEANNLKAAVKCLYSSPNGYCTAGVRIDKGGFISGKSTCNGVLWGGNACDWYKNAKAAKYSVGTTPKIGAIIVWPGYTGNSAGHVGVITGQDKSKNWLYKAYNDYPAGFGKWSYRKVKEFPNSKKPVNPTGYIYTWK